MLKKQDLKIITSKLFIRSKFYNSWFVSMLGYDDLRYFQKIVTVGSLRKASQALKISQPSLSYTIRKLEDEVGTKLLHRSQRGVILTEAGRVFHSKVENLLDHWNNLNSEVTQEVNRELWKIVIGCHPSVANYTLYEVLPNLLLENKELNIILEHGLSRNINDLIIENKVDFGLVINPISRPELIIRPLTTDVVTLWENPNNKNKDTLIYDPALAQTQWLLRQMEKQGIKFKRFIESSNLSVIAKLTTAGAGVGIIPSRVLKDEPVQKYMNGKIYFTDQLCAVYRPDFRKKFIAGKIIQALEGLFVESSTDLLELEK